MQLVLQKGITTIESLRKNHYFRTAPAGARNGLELEFDSKRDTENPKNQKKDKNRSNFGRAKIGQILFNKSHLVGALRGSENGKKDKKRENRRSRT